MSELLLGRAGRQTLNGYGVALLLFVMAPALVLVPLSFSGETALVFPPATWSFRWYSRLVDDDRWRDAAMLSLEVAFFAAFAAAVVGTQASLAISRLAPRVARFLKLVFIAPMVVPLMVIGVGLYVVFVRAGLLGTALSLGLAHLVLVLPFVVLPVSARIASLDPALEQAAASCGAGQGRTIIRVLLPLIMPAIIAGFAFAFVYSFDEVVVAQFLSGPELETLPRKMWEGITVGGLDKTITAISTVELGIALLSLLALELWQRRPRRMQMSGVDETEGAGIPYLPSRSPLRGDGLPQGVRIAFERLSKNYGAHAAVTDLDLAVEPGEFVTVLGPSGSGKTTLLMLAAGFASPDSGRLLIGDRDVAAVPPHRRNIGVVFQSYALFPQLDVRRNVAFPLEARGVRAGDAARMVDWALELVRMGQFGGRRVTELSGGQQQRVALARAIVFHPCALLMDEPLAALDRNLRVEMQGEIRQLQRSLGQTVLYVTHDQEEALNLADRIAVMHAGRLQQVDTPRNLYARPRNTFVASFFGEANLFRGEASGSVLRTRASVHLPLPEPAHGAAALCVRPESIKVGEAQSDFPALEGTVEDIRFQGSIIRILIASPLGPIVATRPAAHPAPPPAIGSTTTVGWHLRHAHVMGDEA